MSVYKFHGKKEIELNPTIIGSVVKYAIWYFLRVRLVILVRSRLRYDVVVLVGRTQVVTVVFIKSHWSE